MTRPSTIESQTLGMEPEICFNKPLPVILMPTKPLRGPIYLKRISGSLIKPKQIYWVGNKMKSLPASRARTHWLCDIPNGSGYYYPGNRYFDMSL